MRRFKIHNPLKFIKTDDGFVSIFRNIGFIGDSLSSGEHVSWNEKDGNGYHDYYEHSWGQYIARKCGLKGYNFSKGGLTAKTFLCNYTPNENNAFVEDKKCECYVIALGVNDMNHIDQYSEGFGSIADVDFSNEENNKDSYVGWYVKIIQKLRKLEPKCRIFVMTTPQEKPETKERKEKYDNIQKFLLELPKYFEFLYVINLRKYAPIYDEKWCKKYFFGGHMSAAGYKITADIVITYMDYIIRHNMDDFTQIGFVGKKDGHHEQFKW